MIVSAKALKGSLKRGERAVKNVLCHGPVASLEFASKANVGGRESEALTFDYKGRVSVMKKGIVAAHVVFVLATVGCIVCVGIKKSKKTNEKSCTCE